VKYSIALIWLTFVGCSIRPANRIVDNQAEHSSNYAVEASWAALPHLSDPADEVPDSIFRDQQSSALVDVFFLHPTTYTGDKGQNHWNASLHDNKLNQKTDRTTILHQASIFNGVGRVYAPRYRQAHLYSYFTKDKDLAEEAFEIAYSDVKASFEYFLKHFNHGRPIILASHSQGTTHAIRLLADYFDDKPLQNRLVVAYLVGISVLKDQFKSIDVCQEANETGCFCSWRSYRSGHLPRKLPTSPKIAVTNPLSWYTTGDYVERSQNKGGVLKKFYGALSKHIADAQVMEGLLWVNKPKFPGSFLLTVRNYHRADYNLFYANVRENVMRRAEIYLLNIEEKSGIQTHHPNEGWPF